VSSDPAGALGPCIRKLIRDADAFLGFLQRGNLPPLDEHRISEWEIGGGRTVRNLVDSLRSLESADPPVQAEYGMKELRRLLFGLIERWGWDRVIGPEGEDFLSEQERLLSQNRRSYLGAVLSHVKAFVGGEISQRPSRDYFEMAKMAEVEGIPPTRPPVLGVQDLEALGKALLHSPYLATEFPTLKEGEYPAIEAATRDLRGGTRDPSPAPPPRGDEQAAATASGIAAAPSPAGTPEGENEAPAGPAAPPRGDGQGAVATSGTEVRMPEADKIGTNTQVARILSRDPHAKAPAIAKEIGKDERTVRNTRAWKANRARLEEKKPRASVRTRPLTDRMVAAIPSKSEDPAEIAAARELEERLSGEDAGPEDPAILERQYLESVGPSEKAEYYGMSPTEREHALMAWKLTRMP
jgi:hypothetical protein